MIDDTVEQAVRAACAESRWDDAITAAVRGYGAELLGYVAAILRDPVDADDVFATACERLWRGLADFGWQSSLRTWAYAVTRNACMSFLRGPRQRRTVHLGSSSLIAVVGEVRARTSTMMPSDAGDRLAEVRAALDADDQTLLVLRIDRKLPWRDVARVFETDDATADALDRRAAALRKRLERLKVELRDRLKTER